MTKKILIIAAALAVTAMTFAACGNKNDADTSTDTSAEVSVTESVSEETTQEAESEDILPDETEEIEVETDTQPEGEETEAQESEAENTEDNSEVNVLYPAVEKALSESEWPMLDEVTDTTIIKEFFTLNPENYSEMIVMQCPISAVMSEIIIIRSDDVQSAKEDLEARRTKAIEVDAWYPKDQENAAASIVGTNGDYAYFIIGDNAAAAEQSINDYINAL